MVSINVSWCLQFWQKALWRTGTYLHICIFASHYGHNCIPTQQFFFTISKNIISNFWNKCLNVSYWQARKADLWRFSFFWDAPCYDSFLNFLSVFGNRKGTQWLLRTVVEYGKEENEGSAKSLPAVIWSWLNICQDKSLKSQKLYRGWISTIFCLQCNFCRSIDCFHINQNELIHD